MRPRISRGSAAFQFLRHLARLEEVGKLGRITPNRFQRLGPRHVEQVAEIVLKFANRDTSALLARDIRRVDRIDARDRVARVRLDGRRHIGTERVERIAHGGGHGVHVRRGRLAARRLDRVPDRCQHLLRLDTVLAGKVHNPTLDGRELAGDLLGAHGNRAFDLAAPCPERLALRALQLRCHVELRRHVLPDLRSPHRLADALAGLGHERRQRQRLLPANVTAVSPARARSAAVAPRRPTSSSRRSCRSDPAGVPGQVRNLHRRQSRLARRPDLRGSEPDVRARGQYHVEREPGGSVRPIGEVGLLAQDVAVGALRPDSLAHPGQRVPAFEQRFGRPGARVGIRREHVEEPFKVRRLALRIGRLGVPLLQQTRRPRGRRGRCGGSRRPGPDRVRPLGQQAHRALATLLAGADSKPPSPRRLNAALTRAASTPLRFRMSGSDAMSRSKSASPIPLR